MQFVPGALRWRQSRPFAITRRELRLGQLHFENATAREAAQTRTLIADLERIVQIIDSDIASQEEQAPVFDRSQADYPIVAKTLAARRDNLRHTIAALEQHLAAIESRSRLNHSKPGRTQTSDGG